jgi:hypothetical protein
MSLPKKKFDMQASQVIVIAHHQQLLSTYLLGRAKRQIKRGEPEKHISFAPKLRMYKKTLTPIKTPTLCIGGTAFKGSLCSWVSCCTGNPYKKVSAESRIS